MTNLSLEKTDRKILDLIQSSLPLVSQPFEAIGERVETTEADVIERLGRIKEAKIVREISAVFDSIRLGYRWTLVAFAVEPERLEEVADIISADPCISHNYGREHHYNLWFTLAAGPGRSFEEEVERLARRTSIDDYLILPALQRFKIRVEFDMGTRDESGDNSLDAADDDTVRPDECEVLPATPELKQIVAALQIDLPLTPRPFERLAEKAGIPETELIAQIKEWLANGVIRRYGAAIQHHRVGYGANGMVCWVVPQEKINEAGQIGSSERLVSHCYERPAFPPRWPYNFFTMIHGQTKDEVLEVLERLRGKIEHSEFDILYSNREFKKRRVRYFTEENATT